MLSSWNLEGEEPLATYLADSLWTQLLKQQRSEPRLKLIILQDLQEGSVLKNTLVCKRKSLVRVMVSILVFAGREKEDPERFLKQYKRLCMANGDRTEDSWL